MGLQIVVSMAAIPAAFASGGLNFNFIGYSGCVDSEHRDFERWTADQLNSLYVDDMSQCACPECEDLCQSTEECIGYDVYCCPKGLRCIAGANVLFSKGTRPTSQPPQPFRTHGYYNSPTTGPFFEGEGHIDPVSSQPSPEFDITEERNHAAQCFAKVLTEVMESSPDDLPPPYGGRTEEKTADVRVQEFFAAHTEFKSSMQALVQEQGENTAIQNVVPIRYSTQVVRGRRWFVKVELDSDTFADVAIYESFTGDAEIVGIKVGVDRDAPITILSHMPLVEFQI